jgi:anti-sigma-K factor RskA
LSEEEHRDIQSLLGAYALGAVDADERRQVEHHLRDCPVCREEVAGYIEVAGLLPMLVDRDDTTPDADDEDGLVVPPVARQPATRLPSWVAASGVAAVLVIIALTLGLVTQTSRLADTQERLAAATLSDVATAAADAEGASTLVLTDTDGERVASVVLLGDGTGLLTIEGLPGVAYDRTYQLWGVMDDEVVSVGLAGDGPGTTVFTADPARLQALVITEEPAGGVPVSEADPLAVWSVDA